MIFHTEGGKYATYANILKFGVNCIINIESTIY